MSAAIVSSRLAAFGRKTFHKRLHIGLLVAFVGLELLEPNPLFRHPYVASQIVALGLITGGLALRAWGSGSAGSHTRSATIEGARLVTGGPFAYLRNPIYLGSIILGVGMSALIGDPLAYALTALAFGLLYFGIIPAEERHLATTFGDEYTRYRNAVPRLIPRMTPWPGASATRFEWRNARGELFITCILVLIYATLHFEEYLDRIFPWA